METINNPDKQATNTNPRFTVRDLLKVLLTLPETTVIYIDTDCGLGGEVRYVDFRPQENTVYLSS